MPDAPDGYRFQPSSFRNVLNDMAELAVRLKSSSFFDRAGSLVYWDDGSNGSLINSYSIIPATGTLKLVAHDTLNFPYCYELHDLGGGARDLILQDFTGVVDASSIGFEIVFSPYYPCDKYQLDLDYGTSDIWITVQLIIDTNTKKITVTDHVHPDVVFTGVDDLTNLAETYTSVKLVVDIENARFKRLIINGHTYDLKQYPIDTTGPRVPPAMDWLFTFHTDMTELRVYVQVVNITVGEP